MIPRLATCWTLVTFAVATAFLPGTAVADFLITVSGTYASSDNETFRTDGTNSFTNDLPPLLDLDRLQGGTFAASFLFPQVTPRSTGANATYPFGPSYGMTFTLFDASGAVVHEGSAPSSAFALIFNDLVTPSGTHDQASFFAFVNTVTNLHTPTAVYTPDQAVSVFQSGIIFGGTVTPTTNYLDDLSIPIDAATYLSFPDRRFSTGVEWTDGDPFDDIPPYQIIDTFVSYDITGVRVSAVPEPGSALLLATGVVAFVLGTRLGRRRRSAISEATTMHHGWENAGSDPAGRVGR